MDLGKLKWLAFVLLPLLALYGNSRPFWYDEVHSIFYARLDFQSLIEYLKSDTHTPTFFLILANWLKIFGENEFALRILPALFYVLSVIVMYLIGRSQYDERTGFVGAFLMMVSPVAVMQSHLLRCYTMLTFLAACSLWLFLSIYRKGEQQKRLFVLLIAVNAIGFLMHLWFLFLIAAECLCALALYRKRLKTMLLFGLCLVPYCVLWLPNLLKQIANRPNGQGWMGPPAVSDLAIILIYFAGAFWLLVPMLFIKSRRSWQFEWFKDPVVIVFSLTLLLPFVLSQVKYIFGYRYAVPALPALILIGARVLSLFTPRAIAITCVALLTCSGWLLTTWARNSEGCNDKKMAAFLIEQVMPSETVIYAGLQRIPIQYYLDRLDGQISGFSLPHGIDRHPDYLNNYFIDKHRDELAGEARNVNTNSSLWVVYGQNKEINSVIEEALEERYEPVLIKDCDCRQVSDFTSVYFTRLVRYMPKHSIPDHA